MYIKNEYLKVYKDNFVINFEILMCNVIVISNKESYYC